MATPSEYVASIYDFAGVEISQYIRDRILPTEKILDVGAGWGKYRFLLPEYEMDAVEVHAPYVEQNRLRSYYRKIFINNIIDLELKDSYGAIILGDVLEHIEATQAVQLIDRLSELTPCLCVATPYEMEQEAVEGNKYEEHQQTDLNKQIMTERYPKLRLLKENRDPNGFIKSVYVKKETEQCV